MKQSSFFWCLLCCLVASTAFSQRYVSYTAEANNRYSPEGNARLLGYINDYRRALGLPEVIYDPGLARAARLQALDNYTKKKFRRRGDDLSQLHQNARFPLVRDRVQAVGVATAGEACAEICYAKAGMRNSPLAYAIRPYQNLEQLMFVKYKLSPRHRDIIATRKYTRVGIHTIYDGHYVYNAVVFMTGKPNSAYGSR